jgi:GNAT superfamily N-acetyltransferase
MQPADIPIRRATTKDVGGIFHVRFAVRENLLTRKQLVAQGITPASVAVSLLDECRAWVAEDSGRIVGFSIADRETSSIFGLFVLPEYQGRGIGRRLLRRAVQWLWDQHADHLWLITDPGTRAASFYARAGWTHTETDAQGELRFELWRPEPWLPNPWRPDL